MSLISCQSLRIAFGGPVLLDGVSLQIHKGERVGLLGRNGEGKSTLFKIVSGEIEPDAGTVVRDSATRISLVTQELPDDLAGSTLDVIASGSSHAPSEEHHADRLCSIFHLDPEADFDTLSGGQKRRALLGRALVSDPDVLLLDEPTNHLDVDHIDQLEAMLSRFDGGVFFVTHDRMFLQRLATRIVVLDRGRLTSWECDYPTFLERRDALLDNEEKERALFDKKLAAEEIWVRRGIKARRTRNEGRVRALEQMRRERSARRERRGEVRLEVAEGSRATARIVEAKNVAFDYGGEPVITGLSTIIERGDKVGIIGPNGCGKTTLLNLLLGTLEPSGGTVKHGSRLEVAYFDQLRAQLDPGSTVAEAVSPESEFVTIGEQRRHINAYLQDFLFPPEAARQPVSSLSGGERNRLLLARLFTRPSNVLVLDEPTNDLDTETLELLEDRLVAYSGTVLVVSHDRAFLDNLCTSTLAFEGDATFKEYVGGYSDWKRTKERQEASESPRRTGKRKTSPSRSRTTSKPDGPGKLSYKEKQEWTDLPGRIEALEHELHQLESRLSDPEFLKGDPDEIRSVSLRAKEVPEAIDRAFDRWAELDTRT